VNLIKWRISIAVMQRTVGSTLYSWLKATQHYGCNIRYYTTVRGPDILRNVTVSDARVLHSTILTNIS